MDLEVEAKNRNTGVTKIVLLREVPDEATQGDLKNRLREYAGPQWDLISFGKVTMESGNEQVGIDG